MAGVYSSVEGQKQLERDLQLMRRGDWVHKRVRTGSKLPGGAKAGRWVDRWLKLVGGGADGAASLEWNKKGKASRKTTVRLVDVLNLGPGLPENVRATPAPTSIPLSPPFHALPCYVARLCLSVLASFALHPLLHPLPQSLPLTFPFRVHIAADGAP